MKWKSYLKPIGEIIIKRESKLVVYCFVFLLAGFLPAHEVLVCSIELSREIWMSVLLGNNKGYNHQRLWLKFIGGVALLWCCVWRRRRKKTKEEGICFIQRSIFIVVLVLLLSCVLVGWRGENISFRKNSGPLTAKDFFWNCERRVPIHHTRN